MLVLSRRSDQKIFFPQLGITVSVLRVKGKLVKLGIEAPQSVDVVRSEVTDESDGCPGMTREKEHQVRNTLNLLQLRLQALQRRLDQGESVDEQSSLESLLGQLSTIDHDLQPRKPFGKFGVAGRPLRLLVVEDCDNERRLMAYVLASHGFDVEVARDGLEAIQRLHQFAELPDCVLMDMNMPQADGLETLLQIRSSDLLKDLRVFAVTGMTRDIDLEPVSNGWDGWFQKPVNIEALLEKLSCSASDIMAS